MRLENRYLPTPAKSVAALALIVTAWGNVASAAPTGANSVPSTEPPASAPPTGEQVATEPTAGEASPAEAAPDTSTAHDAAASEVDAPMPRLSVADAATGAIELLDLASGEVVDTLEATGPTYLSTDGRYVFATDYEGGTVTVIDTGSWVVDHGDHVHAYVGQPAVVGAVEGDHPAHVVPNNGYTAIFFDGTGTSEVLNNDALDEGDLQPVFSFETASPHHGVVVAFADHFAVSIPGPTPDDLPVGVEVRHDDGEIEATFEECPEMHGEAGFTDAVLLACEDGVLWVSGSKGAWDATKLAYPAGTPPGDRTWSFAHVHGVPVVAGILGETALLVIDTETATANRFELPAAPIAVAIAGGGASLVAVTADGRLHLIDAATGTIEASGPAIGAVDTSASEGGPPAPQVVVAGQNAYASDPAAGTVVEVGLDDMVVARRFEVGVVPARLAVTGVA